MLAVVLMTRLDAGSRGSNGFAARSRASGLGLVLALALPSCDIVQGFQNAGDALFPVEKTYLDAPGLRIVAGGYRQLHLTAGNDIYMLARSSQDGDSSLYSMRYADPKPCAIANVARYARTLGTFRAQALIAYLESDSQVGSLHFADATCHVYDLALPNARLPLDETTQGFVVWTGSDLVIANPVADTTMPLASSVQAVYLGVLGGANVVQAQGRLGVFGPDWVQLGSWVGDQVRNWGTGSSTLFYEDSSGIHQVASTSGRSVTDKVIAQDGCSLSTQNAGWAVYYEPRCACPSDGTPPCTERRLVAYGETTSHASTLPVDADPAHLRMQAPASHSDADPGADPYWFFYLRNVDASTGLGTLVVRNLDGQEHELGQNANFDLFDITDAPEGPYGYALVDRGQTANAFAIGRYLYWTPDGSTKELATNVLDAPGPIVDFDGTVGNLAVAHEDRLTVIAERVPSGNFKYVDSKNRWTAIFHDFDGSAQGTLSIADGVIDPAAPPSFEPIAETVGYQKVVFLDGILPGVGYLRDYDPKSGTGRFEYRNLDLEFTATVGDGVSDFLSTLDGLLYTVPFGDNAGIWLVHAK